MGSKFLEDLISLADTIKSTLILLDIFIIYY